MQIKLIEYIGPVNVTNVEQIVQTFCTITTNGATGLSAYEIAVVHGYEGTEEEWIAEFMAKTWWDYILGKIRTGVETTITSGIVKEWVYSTKAGAEITFYRYKATDKSQDAFYSGFDGTLVSGLLAQKKLIIN
jgi:hypothetical protein